jgi:hypothetical protein
MIKEGREGRKEMRKKTEVDEVLKDGENRKKMKT